MLIHFVSILLVNPDPVDFHELALQKFLIACSFPYDSELARHTVLVRISDNHQ